MHTKLFLVVWHKADGCYILTSWSVYVTSPWTVIRNLLGEIRESESSELITGDWNGQSIIYYLECHRWSCLVSNDIERCPMGDYDYNSLEPGKTLLSASWELMVYLVIYKNCYWMQPNNIVTVVVDFVSLKHAFGSPLAGSGSWMARNKEINLNCWK